MKDAFTKSRNGSTVYWFGRDTWRDDFADVVRVVERTVGEALPDKNYVVSGSALLRLFILHVKDKNPGFDTSDVDVYARSEKAFDDLVQAITRETDAVYEDHSARSITFSLDGTEYDFVSWRSGSVFEIITAHDVSASGIGLSFENGEAEFFAVTEEFVRTMKDGQLRLQNGFETSDPVSTARTIDRVFKYKKRGFRPTMNLLNAIAKHIYPVGGERVPVAGNVARKVSNVSSNNSSE